MLFIHLMLLVTSLARAQDATSGLLSRINSLRRSVGLPAYSPHAALTAAASSHAAWMVATGSASHRQDNGSGPRERAQNVGYPSSWVGENIYMGGSPSADHAWSFWLNSPVHYAGLTSPYYHHIGIGAASDGRLYAFVLVFGNSRGRLSSASADTPGHNAAPAPPSYVLGIDAVGNIMHQIQPGDTLGDIALIYGYVWEDIPYMLEINGMTSDDIPRLKIGDVFLVPPQAGTFTPTAAPSPSATPTPSPTATRLPPSPTSPPRATLAPPSPTPTRRLAIRYIPTQTLTPTPPPNTASADSRTHAIRPLQAILIAAAFLQVGIIGAAAFALIRRLR